MKAEQSNILYEDKQVTITREYVLIRKYYFPLATSRTILYPEVERIVMEGSQGVKHSWGVSGKWLNNWFPYDSTRNKKDKFIYFVIKNKKMHPSITPDDPQKVFNILNKLFNKPHPQGQLQEKDGIAKQNPSEQIQMASSVIIQPK